METNRKLTIAQGLKIQREHIMHWRERLNAACFDDLCMHTNNMNSKLNPAKHDGYDVFRGNDITEFVANWRPS